MLKNFFTFVAAAASAALLSASESAVTSWKFPEAADEWNICRHLSVEKTADAIALYPTKKDSSIAIAKTDFDPARFNTLRIYYRAEGFKVKNTTGQLFFGTAGSPRITPQNRLALPSLITDGKNQVMTLDLTRQKNSPLWLNAGKITTLRLDMVDQYPGDVYISKIEFLERPADSTKLTWDFADGLGDWTLSEKLKLSWQDNALFFETTAADSRIINKKCRFAGKLYTQIKITYRAEGFAQRTTGQIFFTSDRNKQFAYKLRRVLPPLTADGKSRSFTVKAPWGDENITSLRLDMVDQHPGKVWIEKIELLP